MSETPATPVAEAPAKKPLKQRLKDLFAEYGRVALVLYFSISILVIISFAVAMFIGLEPTSGEGVAGVLFAAWIAGKATMPIRIPITLAITPPIATWWRKRRARLIAEGKIIPDEELEKYADDEDDED